MLKQLKLILVSASTGLMLTLSPLTASAQDHGQQVKQDKFQHGQGRSLHQQWCVRCHGSIKGDGLTGPNLTKSAAKLTKEEFVEIVTNGKNVGNGFMPAWKSNPRVMGGMDKLYNFLKAHSES